MLNYGWSKPSANEGVGIYKELQFLSNLRYSDDILLAEVAMIWNFFFFKKKECAKVGLHLNIKKTTEELYNFNIENKDIEIITYLAYLG